MLKQVIITIKKQFHRSYFELSAFCGLLTVVLVSSGVMLLVAFTGTKWVGAVGSVILALGLTFGILGITYGIKDEQVKDKAFRERMQQMETDAEKRRQEHVAYMTALREIRKEIESIGED